MRASGIAGAPLRPVGIRRLDVDEVDAVPSAPQGQMRVEPNIGFGEFLESVFGFLERIIPAAKRKPRRPLDGQASSNGNRRRRRRVGDAWLVGYMIDREQNRMRDSPGLDYSPTDRFGGGCVTADLPLLIEDETHGQDRLERVSLCASRWADIGLARRDSDGVVVNGVDRLLGNSRAVVLDRNRAALRRDRELDNRRNAGLLARVERVIDCFLEDDERPVPDIVAGLVLQLAHAAELHETGDLKRDACQFMSPFPRLRLPDL